MSYKYITKYDSRNFGYPIGTRKQNKPKYIVIHHWGRDGQDFDNVVNYLCNNNNDVSAHYVVENGKVACIVNCSDAAWHSGDYWYNTHSIGIECRPEMTQGDLHTVIELVAELFKTYGNLPVIGHRDVVPTACPARYYGKLDYIRKKAIELNGGKAEKPAKKPTPKEPMPAIRIDGKWGYYTSLQTQIKLKVKYRDGIISNQYSGNRKILLNTYDSGWDFVHYISSTGSATAKAIQKKVGSKADGVIGRNTIIAMQKFLGVAADGIMGTETIKAWQRYISK